MKKKYFVICIGIALIIGICIWISQRANNSSDVETIRIGAILPLTGKAAGVGNPAKEGLIAAQTYINDSILYNTKEKVEIIIEDGEGLPAKSLSALNKLTTNDNCNIIFSIVSPVDLSILPIQKKEKFLFFSHASHPKLSNVDDLVFRHSQTVEQEYKLISKAIAKDWTNAAYIYANDDYGVSFNNLIRTGTNTIIEYAINPSDVVNKTIIEKIVGSNPKYIVLNGSTPILMPVITTLKEKGYKGDVYACLGFTATGGIEQDLRGLSIYCVDFNLDHNNGSISQDFEKKYHKVFGTNQTIFFNSALLVGVAIKNGNVNPQSIADYIKGLKVFKGISETLTINDNNDILPPIVIKKIN